MNRHENEYPPIEDHAMIGDLHTIALIDTHARITWFCYPHFDSPSLFGLLLDTSKGGFWSISPTSAEFKTKQFYWPETNVVVTRFFSHDGIAEVVDFMPVGQARSSSGNKTAIIRILKGIRGRLKFTMQMQLALQYGSETPRVRVKDKDLHFSGSSEQFCLSSPLDLSKAKVHDGHIDLPMQISENEQTVMVFSEPDKHLCDLAHNSEKITVLFEQTVDYWQHWLSHCTYHGRWREMVQRSALALKLMTFEPTGAIVAAPTCSLPEELGGVRNWDYRYTWIRDAAFTLYALLRIGFTEEASRFMHWLEQRLHELAPDGSLQIMYGIDGRKELTEHTLEHLEGYRGSSPVRTGNGAYDQLQLDIYGELMDTVYLYNKYGNPISYDLWKKLRLLLNYVCENWEKPDEGIWEIRGGRQRFTYSTLMCWVALDRGLRLAQKRSFPADHSHWRAKRDEMYELIMQKGYNPELKSFMQAFENNHLDASTLMMPLVFFVSPTDPRMLSTIDAILKPPRDGGLTSNSLVYRYNLSRQSDGLSGEEGSFNICTFWLVEALTRAGKFEKHRLSQARIIFEQMLGYANHVGLYAEQTGLHGEALGNFPQAFTHLALISSAFNLDRALSSAR